MGPLRRPLETKHGVEVGLGDPFPSSSPRLSHSRRGELYKLLQPIVFLNDLRSNQ